MLTSFKKHKARPTGKITKKKTLPSLFGKKSGVDNKHQNNNKNDLLVEEDVTADLSMTSLGDPAHQDSSSSLVSSSSSSSISASGTSTEPKQKIEIKTKKLKKNEGDGVIQKEGHNTMPKDHVSTWPTRPIWMCNTGHTKATIPSKSCESTSLPLGQVIDVSNDYFVGKVFLRVRHTSKGEQEMNAQDKAYFAGKKRIFQIVWQGRFTRETPCSDIWMGGIFDRPFNMAGVVRWVVPLLKQVVPGLEMDVLGETPTVLAPASAACKNIHVCLPGEEPDMHSLARNEGTFQEQTDLMGRSLKSSAFRRTITMMSAQKRSQYVYDPKYVYTFEYYDYIMDLHSFEVKVPLLGGFSMKTWFNSQPLSIFVGNKDNAENQALFHFLVYHEKLMDSSTNEEEGDGLGDDSRLENRTS